MADEAKETQVVEPEVDDFDAKFDAKADELGVGKEETPAEPSPAEKPEEAEAEAEETTGADQQKPDETSRRRQHIADSEIGQGAEIFVMEH